MKILARNAAILASFVLSFALSSAAPAPAGDDATALDPSWIGKFEWRSLGPANMGGRITDVAVAASDPTTYWVATASGGLLKTTNNGVTFEHQFDREATVSIGAVAVAPSDPSVVWVGTGEANPRNSVSFGDGVYRSTDGGKTWKNMGIEDSFQIGAIAIHPANPDVVYAGAMGRCWGEHEERGLYKTSDGGATWAKVLSVDSKTGVIDVAMHPRDPDTLLVAAWERQRDGFDTNDPAKKWGPGSALWKTTDGGRTFRKVTAGLPTNPLGRMGIDYSRANPDVVYLLVDCEKIGSAAPNEPYLGITGENAEAGARLTRVVEDGPGAKASLAVGDIVLAIDGTPVVSYEALLAEIRKRKPEDEVVVQVSRDRTLVEAKVTLGKRPESNAKPYSAYLGGQRANVQDEQGPEGFEMGGVYRSEDGGETWKRVNSLNPRPMYFSEIRVDPTDDKIVYVLGVSLHVSRDGGKTFTDDAGRGTHADHHAMWIDPANPRHILLGNDGGIYATWDGGKRWDHLNHVAIGQFYHVALDARAAFNVYGGLQDNGSWGAPARVRAGAGPVNVDWFRVGGGDGFVCAVDPEDPDQIYYSSQNGATGWRNLATGRSGRIAAPRAQGVRYRFNWRTPFILSAHNTKIYYVAGNHVFRSVKGGQELRRISPEITRTERGSGTALAESPLDLDVLYVGSDDGALFGTRDGGHDWVDLFEPAPPPEPAPVAQPEAALPIEPVEASAEAGRSEAQVVPAVQTTRPPADGESEATQEPGPERQAGPDAPRGPGSGGRLLEMLQQADADGDGKLQRSELPERMQAMFDRLDADRSGAIERSEIEAFGSRFRGNRQRGGRPVRAEAAPAEPQAAPAEAAASPSDPVSGRWTARLVGDMPMRLPEFGLTLALGEGGRVTGEIRSEFFEGPLGTGSFDAASGEIRFSYEGGRGEATITARVEGSKMTGRSSMAGGAFAVDFEAERVASGAAPAASAGAVPPAEPAPEPGSPLKDLVPGPRWVASIEASRFAPGRVYLALDGHRSDDDAPYVFASEDYGRTWRSIVSNLPRGSTRVLREDISNQDVLYAGTEFAAFVSIDRGKSWTRFSGDLPTVAVHEFAQHPTTGEIVAATHGRSLWAFDATTLRQVSPETIAAPAHLYRTNTARIWRSNPSRGVSGARNFVGQNPPDGAALFYSLAAPAKEVSLKVTTLDGTLVRDLRAEGKEAGLHRVAWDLRREPPARPQGAPPGAGRRPSPGGGPQQAGAAPGAESESDPAAPEPGSTAQRRGERPIAPPPQAGEAPTERFPGGGGFAAGTPQAGGPPAGGFGGRRGGFGRFGARVGPGEYRVVLVIDGKELSQTLTVVPDPDYPDATAGEEEMLEAETHEEAPLPAIVR